jgi:hypothetical protein
MSTGWVPHAVLLFALLAGSQQLVGEEVDRQRLYLSVANNFPGGTLLQSTKYIACIGLTAYLAGLHCYHAQRPTNEFCWHLLRNIIVTSDDHVTIHEQRR